MLSFREILHSEFEAIKKRNPNFSLRAFSRDLGMNHSTLSLILSGKRLPSYKMTIRMLKELDITKEEEEEFLLSVAQEQMAKKSERMNPVLRKLALGDQAYLNNTYYLDIEKFKVISQWHHFAIFESFHKDNFKFDAEEIARSFHLKISQVEDAVDRLVSIGLLIDENGELRQGNINNDTSDKEKTSRAHRERQIQILNKSIVAIKKQDISKRNHSAMTMAIDPELIPEAKEKIDSFMKELCQFLESGKRTQIYELQTSLFSLDEIKE